MTRRSGARIKVALSAIVLLLLTHACTSQPSKGGTATVRTAAFTFPSLTSVMAAVMQEKGFDRAHEFSVEVRQYGSVATYYAALSVGEVDTLAGGPLVFQKMRQQSMPVRLLATYATMASLVVVSNQQGVSSIQDLDGRRLAADMSSSEFYILKLMTGNLGLDLGSHVQVRQATPAVARAHLESGEVDAMLTFEPAATLALEQIPGAHSISDLNRTWQESSGTTGWLLVSLARNDFLEQSPDLARRWLAALKQTAEFIHHQPLEADRIVSGATSIPPGTLSRALAEGRVEFKVGPAWQHREALEKMFRAAIVSGFADEMPGTDVYFDAGFQ